MNKPTPESPPIDLQSFHIPQHWSPQQALAIFEFLEQLASLVWDQYQEPLILLLQPELDPGPSNQLDLFDFNDDIPF
ncbi:MAG: hypothetical protein ACU841_17345 [Gammaproteobacteria bacterium]